jgi:hypothetical protein
MWGLSVTVMKSGEYGACRHQARGHEAILAAFGPVGGE